ncbi:MAG TPA: MgtC/SapB family protein [Clostridia bacterium]|jgi:putative Mg2+ transporter-C (MgtC) family protein|nr:MgtC/SapB family protein [Clostridia bacterium]HOT69935.1 MgtC/SapB family protein [Clostridia bacterium]HQH64727.1 MgtC/SapB family protein [Clostridia bacterium]
MDNVISYLRELNFVTMIIRIVLAFLCGGLIGMQRERHGRSAGFRTHIIVCIGSALTAMTGIFMSDILGFDTDPMRLSAQVLSGIGFLGVGTILVTGHTHVKGLTTAAGLWTIAAVGLAIGAGFYEAAIICVIVLAIVMAYLGNFGSRRIKMDVYLEITGSRNINTVIKDIEKAGYTIDNVEVQSAKSGTYGNIGLSIVIGIPRKVDEEKVINDITAVGNVVLVVRCD